MRTVHWLFAVGVALFIFGVGFVVTGARQRETPRAVSPALTPVASIAQLMNGIISPGAYVVFDSVGSISTMAGIEEIAPKNAEEWLRVGAGAAAVIEGGNLLLMEGRAVDEGDWVTMTKAMMAAGAVALKAAEAKNTDAILEAGSALNTTCDNCHQRYQRQ